MEQRSGSEVVWEGTTPQGQRLPPWGLSFRSRHHPNSERGEELESGQSANTSAAVGLQPQVSRFSFLCLNFFFGQKELLFFFLKFLLESPGDWQVRHQLGTGRAVTGAHSQAGSSHQHSGAQGPVGFLCILAGKGAFCTKHAGSLLKAEAVPFPPPSQRDRVLADLPILQSRVTNFAGRGVPDFTASCPWELPYHKGMSCTGCKSLVTAITGS